MSRPVSRQGVTRTAVLWVPDWPVVAALAAAASAPRAACSPVAACSRSPTGRGARYAREAPGATIRCSRAARTAARKPSATPTWLS